MSRKIQAEQIRSSRSKRKRHEIEEEYDFKNIEELCTLQRPKKKPKSRRISTQNEIQSVVVPENEIEPKTSSGQQIRPPANLAKIARERNLEFVTKYDSQWISLLRCNLASPNYKERLPGEVTLSEGMRHFILWSLYPTNSTVNQFIESELDPAVVSFLDNIQKRLSKNNCSFSSLKQAMQPAKLKAIANKIPQNFEAIVYKLWDNLYILSQKEQNGSTWSESDFKKNVYSIIDSIMSRKFRTKTNRGSANFEVTQVFGKENKEYSLLIGEYEEKDHSAIEHKHSFKLFELSRCIQNEAWINGSKGFTKISTFGILNGGRKCTLFKFDHAINEKKYNVCWIRDENNVTFTYCFEEFAKILKVLLALWQSLINTETRIQYLLDHPDELQTGHVTTAFISAQNQAEEKALSNEEKDEEVEENRQRVIQDKFEFSELFPAGSYVLGNLVLTRRHRNINFLMFSKLAKWCWANGRSVPYEVEVISNFPVHTIPQPITWASVDDNKYHVIIFNEHFHCPTSAIRKLRQHTYDFIQTLQYIHEKGYVHGDIKLENTSCDRDTDDFHLFDFDHSCKISEVSARHFGTQGHRAPEYLRTRKYTIEAEMFSLGIWLIESFFQRNVQTILSKYRPNFSIDKDEMNAFKILLEIFEEYTSSKPYEEMWIRHCQAISHDEDPWEEININEAQFQHLRTMIRDLLSEDPAKRPSCQELLTDPKYTPFLDTSNGFPLVIPKEVRERVIKHYIYLKDVKIVSAMRI